MRHPQLLAKLNSLQAEMDRVKQELSVWHPEEGEWLMRTGGQIVRRNPSDVRVGNGELYIDNGTLFPTREDAERMVGPYRHAHRILRLIDEANKLYPSKASDMVGEFKVIFNISKDTYEIIRPIQTHRELINFQLTNYKSAEYVRDVLNSGKFDVIS